MALDALRNRVFHRRDMRHTGERTVQSGEPAGEERYPGSREGTGLHLRLPFVDGGMGLARDAGEKSIRTLLHESALRIPVLRRTQPLRAFRHHDEVAPVRKHAERSHHSLDGLVVGLVERVAGRARDHRRETARQSDLRVALHEIHRFEVALAAIAEVHESEPPTLVDHRVEREGAPDALQYLHLFPVKRIALQHAVLRARIGHETVVVEGRDRLGVGDAGSDDLASPRIAGHEVRLDESGGDPDSGLDEAPVEENRSSPTGPAEVDVVMVVARVVVDHLHALEHPRGLPPTRPARPPDWADGDRWRRAR